MELSRAYAYIPLDVSHYDAAELSMYYMQHGSPLPCMLPPMHPHITLLAFTLK